MYRTTAKRIAAAVVPAFTAADPAAGELAVEGVGVKGKRGAFEIFVRAREGADEVQVWSGIKLGPPRSAKFPAAEEAVKLVLEALSAAK